MLVLTPPRGYRDFQVTPAECWLGWGAAVGNFSATCSPTPLLPMCCPMGLRGPLPLPSCRGGLAPGWGCMVAG